MDFDEYINYFFEKLVKKLNKKCPRGKWNTNRIYWNEEGFKIDSPCGILRGGVFNGEIVCEECHNILFKYKYEYEKILHIKELTDRVSKLEGGINIYVDY